ncbi:MAG: major facilitator superfamily domain-containing protein 9 [Coriobacteriia bacterium]|nr:major facilitator superfamily domain-containing protein 9 [Coriobacteriia bacterium]
MKDRRLLVIFSIVLVDMLSFSLVLPLLPGYAEAFGASPFVTGLIFSAYPLMQVIAAPILGRMSDVYGRKPILLLSIGGTACALVLLGFSASLWMLFASRMIDGITGGNISVAQAYMTDITSEDDRGKAFGLVGAAFGLGFIIGPLTGGLLAVYGSQIPAFVAAGLAVVNLLLVTFVLRESLSKERRGEIAAAPTKAFSIRELASALKFPRVGPLMWVRIVIGFTFAVFEGGFTLWAAVALGMNARAIGLVLAYVGVIQVVIQLGFIGPLTKRLKDPQLIVGGTALAALMLVAWGVSPNVWTLLALMPFLSLGMTVANTIVGSALTKAVYADEVGGIIGLSTSVGSLTRIPAPSVAGLLMQSVGVWAPGVLVGVLTAAAVPYAYARLIRRPDAPLPPREHAGA